MSLPDWRGVPMGLVSLILVQELTLVLILYECQVFHRCECFPVMAEIKRADSSEPALFC